MHEQFNELYALTDEKKICLLNTHRNGTGPVGRAMTAAKRIGLDFLFLINMHSNKSSLTSRTIRKSDSRSRTGRRKTWSA